MEQGHCNKPHENFSHGLFACFKPLLKLFQQIKGLHNIDYFSTDIINKKNNVMSFSTNPSINHNLLTFGLWQFDGTLSPDFYENQAFYLWRNTYIYGMKNALLKTKEFDNDFQYAFSLPRKLEDYRLIYSFATKEQYIDHKNYYEKYYSELLSIGDFCFKKIRNFYKEETGEELPQITEFLPFGASKKTPPNNCITFCRRETANITSTKKDCL